MISPEVIVRESGEDWVATNGPMLHLVNRFRSQIHMKALSERGFKTMGQSMNMDREVNQLAIRHNRSHGRVTMHLQHSCFRYRLEHRQYWENRYCDSSSPPSDFLHCACSCSDLIVYCNLVSRGGVRTLYDGTEVSARPTKRKPIGTKPLSSFPVRTR